MTDYQFQTLFAELAQVRRQSADTQQAVHALQHHVDVSLAEMRRHFEVLAEDLGGRIQLVAEGVTSLREWTERRFDEERRERLADSAEIKAMIRVSYADLDRRVTRLEQAQAP